MEIEKTFVEKFAQNEPELNIDKLCTLLKIEN